VGVGVKNSDMSKAEFTVLDNSNIVESYPGITLPLTCSFAKIAYKGVFKGIVGANLKNEDILAKYDHIFDNMISSYNGRIYYCINNWYSLIDFMPFSKKIIPVWQDMMGVASKEIYLGIRHKFTFWQKAKLYLNLFKNWLHVPNDMNQLMRDFNDVKEYFNDTYKDNLSVKEYLALFHEIEKRVLDKWYVTLYNDMYAFIWTGLLKRKLARKGIDVAKYISGLTSLESLKPVKTLFDIVKECGDDADILSNPKVLEYLEAYGDRSPCELKLEVMTYREDPLLLENRIREYARDKIKLDKMISNLSACDDTKEKSGFYARRARIGIINREISRLNRSRIYGMVRRIFIRIGEILCHEGWIDEWSDVFYLQIQEIESGENSDFKQIIAKRKAEYREFEKLPSHTRLVFRGNKLVDEKIAANWTGCFQGVGASTGCVTAEAVVLESPDSKLDVKGKIIVTKTTDPGWVFLLTMASGIISEKGSLLSHTAIISRELNIPASVAVDSATSVIKTGDIVKLDGNTGRIEIVQTN
jgi:pyruvate,water dikinase